MAFEKKEKSFAMPRTKKVGYLRGVDNYAGGKLIYTAAAGAKDAGEKKMESGGRRKRRKVILFLRSVSVRQESST